MLPPVPRICFLEKGHSLALPPTLRLSALSRPPQWPLPNFLQLCWGVRAGARAAPGMDVKAIGIFALASLALSTGRETVTSEV